MARFERIERKARIKLEQLNQAASLNELRTPPSNRLHVLKGDRHGQHRFTVNMQYRICFTWTEDGPAGDELADYP